ncbi:peptidoglycan-binding domain-containing protein [Streptomyces lanatus]|uniref:Peptidoglycan-binding domain-containing protein n=1 Tax=Streptomyces lanatus TaxID=66900 RepID=A0ABV1Y3V6_9ACTN|nr:peptidoglycan-binding domain-containing protein [Streptomyces lanatus]
MGEAVTETTSPTRKGCIVKQRVSTTLRLRISVLGALAFLFAAGLTASPMMTEPAHAAYGPCNTTAWRDVPHLSGTVNEYKIPARTDNGISCYMGYQVGSRSAVEALQQAIIICYGGTWAAQRINNSGGADGIYGTGTVEAVRWLQNNKLGLSGSADGVYGPDTRSHMQWPHYYDRGALLYSCSNPSTF